MIVKSIVETRWSAIGQSIVFAFLLTDNMFIVFRGIPKGVLAGLLLSIGSSQLITNDVLLGLWNMYFVRTEELYLGADMDEEEAQAGRSLVGMADAVSKIYDAFLTHNWGEEVRGVFENHAKVEKIYEGLTSVGIRCWFDREKLRGNDIRVAMYQGVAESRTMICFITKAYKEKVNQHDKRDACKYEVF